MAEVYLLDSQLDRPVALKILPAQIAPLDGSGSIKVIDPVAGADQMSIGVGVTSAPDGRSIWYVNMRDGTANL